MKSAVIFSLPLALGACSPNSSSTVRSLDDAEARATTGGISVEISSPSSNSSSRYDDVEFRAQVTSALNTEPTYISLWAGNTKVADKTYQFSGTEQRSWSRRSPWELAGAHDAQFKVYYRGQFYETDGDSGRSNVRVHSSVRVHPVRFWNVRNKNVQASVSGSFLRNRVDAATKNRSLSANNIDAIFGQCSGNAISQFRYDGAATLTVQYNPGSNLNCTDLNAVRAAHCPNAGVCDGDSQDFGACPELLACIEEMALKAQDWDATKGRDTVHVFHVNETACVGDKAVHIGYRDAAGVLHRLILMRESEGQYADRYTRTLAHEIVHDVQSHCGHSFADCSTSECVGGAGISNNLMCGNDTSGRTLNAAQCTRVAQMYYGNINAVPVRTNPK